MKRSVEKKKVIVAGMGKSGVAAALLLKEMGAEVKASDNRDDDVVRESTRILRAAGVECGVGEQGGALIEGADLLVVSPGVGGDAAVVSAAREMGVEVAGEIELAYWFWPGGVIAVTGTNGKTTTAHMIKAILDSAGMRSVLTGNIGYPFSSAVLEHGDAGLAILELSSFQLEHISLFHPGTALLLNLAPDHLDRYGDVREYYAFKLAIFSNLERGDRAVFRWEERELIEPLLSRNGATGLTFGLEGGGLTISGDDVTLDGERIFSLVGFGLRGRHNLENALAAAAAADACGVERDIIEMSLRSFEGLPHRLEHMGTYGGIDFYNDSKSTNLDAMLKALSSFSGMLILIAGGKDKGEDYGAVREAVVARARAVFLIGESRDAMKEALSGCCEAVACGSLDEAAAAASALAVKGDTVLLSPGCSSLDMYGGFEERGDHFKRIIRNLRGVDDE